MRAILDDHMAAAVLTDDVTDFILDLDLVQLLLRTRNGLLKIRIKIPYDRLPLYCTVCNAIQKHLEVRGKAQIHDLRELFAHNVIDDLAKLRDIEILLLFRNISACQDR